MQRPDLNENDPSRSDVTCGLEADISRKRIKH